MDVVCCWNGSLGMHKRSIGILVAACLAFGFLWMCVVNLGLVQWADLYAPAACLLVVAVVVLYRNRANVSRTRWVCCPNGGRCKRDSRFVLLAAGLLGLLALAVRHFFKFALHSHCLMQPTDQPPAFVSL